VALDPKNPETSYRQDHCGIYVSHDGMESWKRVGKVLPSDFGFIAVTAPARAGEAYFVPLEEQTRTMLGSQPQMYRWSEKTRKFTPLISGSPWQGEIGTHREGMAADSLDPPGLYLGTTTGQVFFSSDAGKKWGQIPYMFPSIHSVSASSPVGVS
jgi:hypothetical protein